MTEVSLLGGGEATEQAGSRRWGWISGLSLAAADDHTIDFDAVTDVSGSLDGASELREADGGHLLIRFDVDEAGYSVVHVDPRGGWYATTGSGPADLVRRGASYLGALADRLEAIEALA